MDSEVSEFIAGYKGVLYLLLTRAVSRNIKRVRNDNEASEARSKPCK